MRAWSVKRQLAVAATTMSIMLLAGVWWLVRPAATKMVARYAAPTESAAPVGAIVETDALTQFREERKQTREDETRQLRALIDSEKTSSAMREQAAAQLAELAACMEREVTIEGILRARGFPDPLVTVHAGSVNVLVRLASLTDAQAATILDVAVRETGQRASDIRIVPIV